MGPGMLHERRAQRAGENAEFPYVDGKGHSTQLYVVSDDETDMDSQIDFFKTDGNTLEVILR